MKDKSIISAEITGAAESRVTPAGFGDTVREGDGSAHNEHHIHEECGGCGVFSEESCDLASLA